MATKRRWSEYEISIINRFYPGGGADACKSRLVGRGVYSIYNKARRLRLVSGYVKRHFKKSMEERFWEKVDKSGGQDACWVWNGAKYNNGRGVFSVNRRPKGASRVSWEIANGPIPIGDSPFDYCVCHSCDNHECVNPRHLFLGSQASNVADKVEKGRQARGVMLPHTRLTPEDVRNIRNSSEPGSALARRYGVRGSHIYDIKYRRRHSHIQ